MFDELLDRFINFLRVEKGLSANTLESYSRDLIGYLRFLEAQGITAVSQTQTDTLYEYLKTLRTRDLSSRSQARALVGPPLFLSIFTGRRFAVRQSPSPPPVPQA